MGRTRQKCRGDRHGAPAKARVSRSGYLMRIQLRAKDFAADEPIDFKLPDNTAPEVSAMGVLAMSAHMTEIMAERPLFIVPSVAGEQSRKLPGGGSHLNACSSIGDVTKELLRALPHLRSCAVALCGNAERAEDLVQETVVRALANIGSFEPGTNMLAWLSTILRNHFYSEFRKRRREIEDDEGLYASRLETPPTQEAHAHLLQVRDALDLLAPDHREALILVGASGLSYDDAAAHCGCPVGTMKSRVSRARGRLAGLLGHPEADLAGRPLPIHRGAIETAY